MYRESHYKDKTIVGPFYVYSGNLYIGKTTPAYFYSNGLVRYDKSIT